MEALIQIVAESVLDINNILVSNHLSGIWRVFFILKRKKTENQRVSGNYHFQHLKLPAKYDIISRISNV